MATLGIGPVPRMDPGGGRQYSSKPRRHSAEPRPIPVAAPSYEIEKGAPIGAKKWLKSLLQSGAIHLSTERIAGLLGRRPKEEKTEKATQPGNISCGPTCRIYREAVELEERDAATQGVEKPTGGRGVYLGFVVGLGAAAVFGLTMAALDAVFGTHCLPRLFSLVLP